jgi:hypothetical protein
MMAHLKKLARLRVPTPVALTGGCTPKPDGAFDDAKGDENSTGQGHQSPARRDILVRVAVPCAPSSARGPGRKVVLHERDAERSGAGAPGGTAGDTPRRNLGAGLWIRKKSIFASPSLRCAPTPWPAPRFSFLRDDQNGTRLTPATSIKKMKSTERTKAAGQGTWARAVPAPTLQYAGRTGGEGGAAAVAGIKKPGRESFAEILSPPKETFRLRSRGG